MGILDRYRRDPRGAAMQGMARNGPIAQRASQYRNGGGGMGMNSGREVPGLPGVFFPNGRADAAMKGARSVNRWMTDKEGHPGVSWSRGMAGLDASGMGGGSSDMVAQITAEVMNKLRGEGIEQDASGSWGMPGLRGLKENILASTRGAGLPATGGANQALRDSMFGPGFPFDQGDGMIGGRSVIPPTAPGRGGTVPVPPGGVPPGGTPPTVPPTVPPKTTPGDVEVIGRGTAGTGKEVTIGTDQGRGVNPTEIVPSGQGTTPIVEPLPRTTSGGYPDVSQIAPGTGPAAQPGAAPSQDYPMTALPQAVSPALTGQSPPPIQARTTEMPPPPGQAPPLSAAPPGQPLQPAGMGMGAMGYMSPGALQSYQGEPDVIGRGTSGTGEETTIGTGSGSGDINNPATAGLPGGGQQEQPPPPQPLPTPTPSPPPPQPAPTPPAPAPSPPPPQPAPPGTPGQLPPAPGPATTPQVPAPGPGRSTSGRVQFPEGFPFDKTARPGLGDTTPGAMNLSGLSEQIRADVAAKMARAGIGGQGPGGLGDVSGLSGLGERIRASIRGGIGEMGVGRGAGTAGTLGPAAGSIMESVRRQMGTVGAPQPGVPSPGLGGVPQGGAPTSQVGNSWNVNGISGGATPSTTMPPFGGTPRSGALGYAAPGTDWTQEAQHYAAPAAPIASTPPEYIDSVSSAAAENGVPANLLSALLERESSWDPNAQNPSGAAGMGQFMPGTAAEMGLVQLDAAGNVIPGTDRRFDADASINAAAQYLKQQYDATGSWELALAAYHAGLGNVQAAGNQIPDTSDGLTTTADYVAQIMQKAGPLESAGAPEAIPAGPVGAPSGEIPMGNITGGGDWNNVNRYDAAFTQAGTEYGVDPAMLKAMAIIESGGTGEMVQGGGGAYGLMQMKLTNPDGTPTMWANVGTKIGADPMTPEGQIAIAAFVLGGNEPGITGTPEEIFLEHYYPTDCLDCPAVDNPNHTQRMYLEDIAMYMDIIHGAGGDTGPLPPDPTGPATAGLPGVTVGNIPGGTIGGQVPAPGTGTIDVTEPGGTTPAAPSANGAVWGVIAAPAEGAMAPSGEPISVDDAQSTTWIDAAIPGAADVYLQGGGYGFGEDQGAYCNGRPCYEDYENWGCGTCHTGVDIPTYDETGQPGSQAFSALDAGKVVCLGGQNETGEYGAHCGAAGGCVGCAAYGDDSGGPGQLTIETPQGALVTYGHIRSAEVEPGEEITPGTALGMTGSLNGYHLHAEVQLPIGEGGSYVLVDPNLYYGGFYCQQGFCPTPGGAQGYQSLQPAGMGLGAMGYTNQPMSAYGGLGRGLAGSGQPTTIGYGSGADPYNSATAGLSGGYGGGGGYGQPDPYYPQMAAPAPAPAQSYTPSGGTQWVTAADGHTYSIDPATGYATLVY